jgi:hypothetical protein
MGALIPFLIAIFCLTACGSKLPGVLDPGRAGQNASGQTEAPLQGVLRLADGTPLDFGAIKDPLVVSFAAYTCGACRSEARAMTAYFTAKGSLPKNARLFTVLVGGSPELAQRWQRLVCPDPGDGGPQGPCVNLPVALDEGDALFKSRCPENLTPCVFTQSGGNSPQVNRRVGEVAIDQLEKETGPWNY